jgi:ABC-type branched-subunit amino acid transport system ATPase component
MASIVGSRPHRGEAFIPQAAGKNPVKDDGATVLISTIVKAPNLNVGRRPFSVGMRILIAAQSAHVTLRVANCVLALEAGCLVLGCNANALILELGAKEAYFGAVS